MSEVLVMMGGWNNGWWMLMWLWMAAFWLVVIGAVLWAVMRAGSGHRSVSSALDALDRRLASGEITVEEFRRLKTAIGDDRGRPHRRSGQLLIGGIAAVAVVLFVAGPAWALADSDWSMWGHMRGMMGGGTNTSNAPLVIGGNAEAVTVSDFAFSPGNLRVPVGATVTWTNRDAAPHNATARDGSWKTETLSRGESGSVTFDHAGEYDYYCTIHPSMKAHLSVQ